MGLYLRNKVWWMCYKLLSGEYVRVSTDSKNKKTAETIYAKQRVAIAENRYLDIKKESDISFRDFGRLYLERHSKPNKKSWKSGDEYGLKRLNRFFGDKILCKMTQAEIEEYIAIRRSTKAKRIPKDGEAHYILPATINRELACLKTLFAKAVDWGYAKCNPCARVKMLKEDNRRTRFLTLDEMERLLQAATPGLRDALVVLIHTGMRMGEMRRLRWTDLDFDSGLVKLSNTKNGKTRFIPMNEAVKQVLLRRRLAKESQTWVFAGREDKPWDFRVPFEKARHQAKLEDFHIHDLRHTFASWLCMNGVDLMTVKELLGHSTMIMTERYSHLTGHHKADAVAKLVTLPINHVTIMSQSTNPGESGEFEKIVSSLESKR